MQPGHRWPSCVFFLVNHLDGAGDRCRFGCMACEKARAGESQICHCFRLDGGRAGGSKAHGQAPLRLCEHHGSACDAAAASKTRAVVCQPADPESVDNSEDQHVRLEGLQAERIWDYLIAFVQFDDASIAKLDGLAKRFGRAAACGEGLASPRHYGLPVAGDRSTVCFAKTEKLAEEAVSRFRFV